jgi:LCP family protein required for cell wall assembly
MPPAPRASKPSRPSRPSKSGKPGKPGKAGRSGKTGRTRRSPLWAKLFVVLGGLLMLLSGGTLVATKMLLDAATSSVHQIKINTAGNVAAVPQGHALNGALNILLAGLDSGQATGKANRTDLAHSDSMMILHVPATHDQGYIVSLPRDLWVTIPGHGQGKLNAAYTFGSMNGGGSAGGLNLLMQTINSAWGIKFNAAATIDFGGFTVALQQLGGVTMDIDERVVSVHYGTDGHGHSCVPALFNSSAVAVPVPGCYGKVYARQKNRRLSPVEALDYTRQREWMELNDGDYGRQRHQQQFIKALIREAAAQGVNSNPAKALGLIKSAGGALSMWTNGASLIDWFFTLKDIAGSNIAMIKTNNGQFHSETIGDQAVETLDDQSIQMLHSLRDGKIADFLLAHPGIANQSS